MYFSLSFNFVLRQFELRWLHSNFYPTKLDLSVKEEASKETQKSASALFASKTELSKRIEQLLIFHPVGMIWSKRSTRSGDQLEGEASRRNVLRWLFRSTEYS
jgi:hypothetical protein